MFEKLNHIHKTGVAVLAIFLLTLSTSIAAGDFHSLQSIRMHAESYIHQYPYESPYAPRFKVSQLDSRLRLKSCPAALSIEFAHRDKIYGNTALNISCPAATGWKILLPVEIDLYDDVLVLNRSVPMGQIIDANLVTKKKKRVSRLNNGYFANVSEVAGLEAKRNLKIGAVLSAANLTPKLMIKSGQQVTLILEFKGLKIRSSGQSLQSARRGEVIKVRNNQSGKIVEGVVSGEAEVRIHI